MRWRWVVLLCAAHVAASADFKIETFHLPESSFDPEDPAVQELLRRAGVIFSGLAPLKENVGLNSGVWSLGDGGDGEMIMKFRQPAPEVAFMPEEAHHISNLLAEIPALSSDPGVVVPFKIFECRNASDAMLGHIFVMRRAPGRTLALVIGDLLHREAIGAVADAKRELAPIFEQVGRSLASFHARYGGRQHNDFQGSNILVDAGDGNRVTLIDFGMLGVPIGASDLRHFEKANARLAAAYPPDAFFEECFPAFEKGYYSQYAQEASCPAPPEEAATSFRVAVPRPTAGLSDLGLEVAERDGGAFVAGVGAAGLIAKWNKYVPSSEVRVGQRIAVVNGRTVSSDNILDVLREIRGELGKDDEVDIWSSSARRWVSHGRILTTSQWMAEVEHGDEEGAAGATGSRATYPLFEVFRRDRGVLEMLIVAAPAISDNSTRNSTRRRRRRRQRSS